MLGEELRHAKVRMVELAAEVNIKDEALQVKDAITKLKDDILQSKEVLLQTITKYNDALLQLQRLSRGFQSK